ncbi:MAG: DUF6701 domain-containing protein [Pseudohongiellaceae bacterium]|nr:DUF6701 domain-containing protein [Pseudohongiellaceae bacterium]
MKLQQSKLGFSFARGGRLARPLRTRMLNFKRTAKRMITGATLVLANSTMVFAQVPGPLTLQGSGGTITSASGYTIHTFTAGGTFTPPTGVSSVDVIVLGGGGGGGSGNASGRGGGGGAGRLEQQTVAVSAGVGVAVTVGTGGGGGSGGAQGSQGGASSFGAVSALGGGGGGGGTTVAGLQPTGTNAGSGGGGGSSTSGNSGGTGGAAGTPAVGGENSAGGDGRGSGGTGNRAGGGGGGASAAGSASPANGDGGAGGAGAQPANWGLATFLAGGGGGSGGDVGGAGGSGVGGTGALTGNGGAATANTGSGGGGAANGTGGAGSAGIVMVRYLAPTLTLSTQPSTSVSSGVVFPQQPQITLLDGSGSGVNNIVITAALSSGSATLGGTTTAATNASGVATFTDLSLTGGAGVNQIAFTAAGASEQLVSNDVTIVAQSLAVSVQPSASVERGVQFPQQPVILADNGSPVSGLTITASIFSGGGTLDGTATAVTNASGLATFTDLAILGEPGDRVLQFTATGWSSVDSNTISITASDLAITQQASATVTSGALFAQQPIVQAVDGGGNPISGVTVTAAVQTGGGALSGTVSRVTDGSGNATFDDLVLTGSGAHTLNFSATGWGSVVSNSIDVQVTVQDLALSVQPSASADLGIAFAQQPVVLADDGSPVSGLTITASLASGDGTLAGTLSAVTDGSGLASFTDLYITGAGGNHVLRFTAPAWSLIDSNTVSVANEALAMSQQPSASVESGEAFPVQPAVRALDAAANPVSGVEVSVTIQSGGGSLGGTLTATTNGSGIATFTDLAISGGLGDRVLRFSATGWDAVDSSTVSVVASDLTITQQPSASVESGVALAQQPIVQALDGGGNPVSGLSVTASIFSGGGTLGGTVTVVTDGSGLASFTDLDISGAPGDRVLRFSATDWNAVDSDAITVFSNLVIDTQPSASATSGFAFAQQPVIEAIDGDSNPVAGLTITASLASGGGTLGGTLSAVTNGSGLATFTDLTITGTPGDRTLEFTATDWGPVTSNTVTISAAPGACAYEGGLVGTQIVQLVGCTQNLVSPGSTTITLDVPPGTSENDLLVTAISAKGNGISVTGPAGWTEISDLNTGGGANGVTLAIYTRIAGAAEPATYNFTTSGSVESYSYMMRFENTTGVVIEATEATGSSANATAPDLVTTEDNTLIVRMAAVGGTMTTDPATIITGHRNITQDASAQVGGSGAYFNQENFGSTGTASFTHNSERWAAQTIGIEPADVYHFEITHALSHGTCNAETPITISVFDIGGNPVLDYDGQVLLTTSDGNGDFTLGDVAGTPGAFSNVGNGFATYDFNADNDGQVVFNFSSSNAGTITFDATDGADVVTENYALSMVLGACSLRIEHDGAANVCSVEPVTISVVDTSENLVSFVGAINISTVGVTGGNWTKTSIATDANGALDNGAANDGAATYTFDADDAGDIILNFQNSIAETVNFNIAAAGVAGPSGSFDPSLTSTACTWQITHSEASDVCSLEQITITLADNVGDPVTNYSGTINLSTTTSLGTWSKTDVATDAEGTLTDSGASNGAATYLFDSNDDGSITVNLFHPGATGNVNINVSDGTTLDPRNSANAFDRNIVYSPCTIQISHSGSTTACELEAITFSVINSNDGPALDYTGTITLGTGPTNHGNWYYNDADGMLTDTDDDDNGVATYKFEDSDDGTIVLDFSNPHFENVNFDATATGITVDVNEDPTLVVSSCLPTASTPSCVVGNSTTIDIPAQNSIAAQRGRMVLMAIAGASGAGPDASSVTFDGQAMTLLRQEKTALGEGSVVELWGILDADMPDTAGTYTGSFADGVPLSGMCLIVLDEVSQTFPVEAGSPEAGPINGNVNENSATIETTITTQANNSIIVSATNMDGTTDNFTRIYADPEPSDVLTRIWGEDPTGIFADPGNVDPNLADSRFGGASGRKPTASIVNVVEELAVAGTAASQVVAAFEPLIAGDPIANGYVPVVLFETFSGNMSYWAGGNTLRSTQNADGPAPLGCNFIPAATGSATTLSLPVGAQIEAAYLYWFGSGDDELGHVDADVDFGPTGSEISITADDVFLIDNVGNGDNLDYFAGYREVSDIVTATGSYTLKNLVVQNGTPWSNSQACAGGWALVVVYEHADERLRVLNLFHGFQPFQNSSFTLVPRNFRMATRDPSNNVPNGQVTHITVEGDETLNATDGAEGLGLQVAPGSTAFDEITSSVNPLGEEFNGTVSRPVYVFDGGTGYFEFDATGGVNNDGYEVDNPGPEVSTGGPRFGNTWGVDVDTHYFQGANDGEPLYEFAAPGTEAEQITTRYSAEADLVLLVSEVISVTNFDLADIEIFKTSVGDFTVNGTGTYEIRVVNNGNGSVGGGYANGEIIVADILPTGMTFDAASDVSGDDWSCTVTLDPGAFTCTYDIDPDWTGGNTAGRLEGGEELPTITVNVQIGDATDFPFLSNEVENSARVLHSGGSCTPAATGLIPDPDTCVRSPQFDNYNDLQGGVIDINDLDDKQLNNNNVDGVTTEVRGIETDLQMTKFVDDILEEGEQATYTLRVTNNGPDATTSAFTVTDTEPTGLSFTNADGGADWSCPTPPGNLSCTYIGPSLGVGASTDITLTVDVTGAGGYLVSNTATVSPGANNFDTNPTNDSDTDITEITAAPVASNEKFLLSVSSLGETTTIGGLDFADDDYIIYDPVTDTAEMFFDNSALGFDVRDADAVHLMKNGHIVISPETDGSSVGSNNLLFNQGDLVVYDPILGDARMLFDGSTIFGGLNPEDVDINAVYIQGDCNLIAPFNCTIFFSATPAAGGSTVDGVSFDSSDIVQYDLDTGNASLFFDGSTHFDDTTNVTIDAFYTRVDPSDPDAVIDTLIISANDSSDDSITIGATVGWDPVTGTFFTQDDVTEIDLSGETTQNLFLGDVEFGDFESTGDDADLLMDALHVVEDGYIGHFRVSQEGGNPTVCSATGIEIRISKHMGLSHDRDTDYFGSIRISTDTGEGDWAEVLGNGSLDNGTADDGEAIYTFTPSDQGTIVLTLNQSTPGSVNVDVTNGIAREGHPPGTGAEAPIFSFDAGVDLYYADTFSSASFANQNGDNAWASNWVENDDNNDSVITAATTGDVKVQSGKAVFTAIGGTTEPSLERTVDLSGATLSTDLILDFDYSFAGIGTFEEFVVEARHSSAASWEQVALYKRGTTLPNVGSGSGASGALNISSVLAGSPTASTQIRFRVKQGYTLSGQSFSIDNVELSASTNDCDVSPLGVSHYAIAVGGVTSTAAGPYNAVACVGMEVTITAHDSGHVDIDPGNVTINLSAVPARGNWSRVVAGTGTLLNGTANNGAATYEFPSGEESVTFWFDYPSPSINPEEVNISVTDGTATEDGSEDPLASVSQVGLRILNSSTDDDANPIPLQIAGKPSNVDPISSVLVVQAVQSDGDNPSVCSPLFDVGQTLEFEFAAECEDADTCVGGETFEVNTTSVPLIDAGDPINYVPVEIEMQSYPSGPGAPIVIEYSDVGRMRLHTRFDIPYGDEVDPLVATKSGETLDVTSNQFVVRPFGFDIDFDDGRENNGTGDASYAADETGSAWKIAGESFNTTVSAVAWEAVDDDSNINGNTANDGVPDSDADLSDNHVTPNFDQDSEAADYSVLLSVTDNKVIADSGGGILGELTSADFDNFTLGVATHTIVYNEVGIIDIQGNIVDVSDTEISYLATENVRGFVYNVGRFYPNLFQVTNSVLNSRADQACEPASSFTYLGEEFEVDLDLVAKGLTDSGNYTTVNYRGNYAFLDTYEELSFVAIDDIGGADDVDYTLRLSNSTVSADFSNDWNNGLLSLTGNLILERADPAAPDGPFDDMQIAFLPTDDDDVTIDPARDGSSPGILNVDLDVLATEPDDALYYLIEEHEFRYGRLVINNAYGPETEDLDVTLDIEYFDGERFVRNTLDDCTLLNVADLGYVPGTYTGDLDAIDTSLNDPETSRVIDGQLQGLYEDLGTDPDELGDTPFVSTAPGEGNSGTVDVEYKLSIDDDMATKNLEYLGFDWGDTGTDYNTNPTGQLEFGQFRMHDRVINWREIYNRATPPE